MFKCLIGELNCTCLAFRGLRLSFLFTLSNTQHLTPKISFFYDFECPYHGLAIGNAQKINALHMLAHVDG